MIIDAKTAARLSHEAAVVLVDVRSSDTWHKGVPEHAKLWSHAELFNQAEQLKQDGKKVFILCYRGQSSAQLVEQLQKQWGGHFYSVEGGYEAWVAAGLAIVTPDVKPNVDRYERQVKLPEFGVGSQNKLQKSHVLVVGAGGVGAPALLYLTGAGVGRITLIDDDTVALHNLHRQILYQQDDIGQPKAALAKQRLEALNENTKVRALEQRLSSNNVDTLLHDVDLVIDGSDNIDSRYVINDACLKQNKPWLFAAVSGFDIQLALFSGDKRQPCYRCLFPSLDDSKIGNCSDAGVLGPVPGLAGVLQACEAIKYLAGMEGCLSQKMLSYDVLNHHFKVLKYPSQVNNSCNH